jgi:hypothetical protein
MRLAITPRLITAKRWRNAPESRIGAERGPLRAHVPGFPVRFLGRPSPRSGLVNLEDVEGVRILGGARETMGIEAGEGSTFAHFLTPWGMMLEFVSFPNGRYMENRDQLLWSPVNPAA